MRIDAGRYSVKLAEGDREVAAAQRLRYSVFVEEMGATPSDKDREDRRERDRFDEWCDHLLLIDTEAAGGLDEQVVGVYRLMKGKDAKAGIGFYGQSEYDLSKLAEYPRPVVELGRSCISAEHRGGAGMHLMWSGLGQYVADNDIEIMFGVASFHGTDPDEIAVALSYLHHNHLAPEDLRVTALGDNRTAMDLLGSDEVDRGEALRQMPTLIKAYIRLGGFVGDGAWIDREFNTIDVCLLMDTTRMVDRYRKFYSREKAAQAEAGD